MGYLGSKGASGAYQAVIASMPPHDTYIETHLGSGVVMLAKPRAGRQIGVDLDRDALADFGEIDDNMHPAVTDELHNVDAVDFLTGFDFTRAGRVLIYADPPYVLATRTSTKRYRHDYTDANHVRLVAALRAAPALVILSGYPSDLYDGLLPDWRHVEFQVMTRGGPRTERLWFNFPAGKVQWARYAGSGFTDRQRIKRKAERWAAHYRRLAAGERLAVLSAVLAEESQVADPDAPIGNRPRPAQPAIMPISDLAETSASMAAEIDGGFYADDAAPRRSSAVDDANLAAAAEARGERLRAALTPATTDAADYAKPVMPKTTPRVLHGCGAFDCVNGCDRDGFAWETCANAIAARARLDAGGRS